MPLQAHTLGKAKLRQLKPALMVTHAKLGPLVSTKMDVPVEHGPRLEPIVWQPHAHLENSASSKQNLTVQLASSVKKVHLIQMCVLLELIEIQLKRLQRQIAKTVMLVRLALSEAVIRQLHNVVQATSAWVKPQRPPQKISATTLQVMVLLHPHSLVISNNQ